MVPKIVFPTLAISSVVNLYFPVEYSVNNWWYSVLAHPVTRFWAYLNLFVGLLNLACLLASLPLWIQARRHSPSKNEK